MRKYITSLLLIVAFIGVVPILHSQSLKLEIISGFEFYTPVYGLTITSTGTLIAAGSGEGVLRSTDRGNSWTYPFARTHDWGINSVLASKQDVVYALNYPGTIYRSTDDGLNWEVVFDTSMEIHALNVRSDGMVLLGVGKDIFFSKDIGNHWSTLSQPPYTYEAIYGIGFNRKGDILIGSQNASLDSGVFISSDEGNSWRKTLQPYKGLISSFLLDSSGNLFLSNGSFYKSTDDGNTWINKPNFFPLIDYPRFAVAPKGGIASVIYHYAYFSPDLGETWTPIESPASEHQQYYSVAADKEGFIYVGGLDTIYRSITPLSKVGITPSANDIFAKSYPNPFTNQTTITYELRSVSSVKAEVCDVTGRIIQNYFKEYQTQGKHELLLDLHNNPPGVYIVTLTANNRNHRLSIVKMD